ncbi:MAG: patatin-like phospholipase family protein [Bacteroidales bacterium]|nr:patatin-like phospholipase family protein [Bacteroidales bacterium]
MKHFAYYITFALFLLGTLNGFAQSQTELGYGVDPQRDSAAIQKYRHRMDSIRRERPTVALVLSGGGAKGAAHISVIKYLERIGMPIDLVMGTSIGGLVSGLYASGYSGEELEAIIRNQDWNYLLRDTHPRKFDALTQKDYDRKFQLSIPYGSYKWDFHKPEINSRSVLSDGIVQGRNIEDLFASLTIGYGNEMEFINLPIPFVCVATDMITAKPKVWFSGNLVDALRSTLSIPGLFTPVKKHGMVLMDGSMRSNFPAEIAKQLGADIIIGVDVSAPALNASQMRSMLDIVYQTTDLLGREAYIKALEATNIYIQPELSDFTLLSFDKESIATMLERGKQAVEQHASIIDSIRQQVCDIPVRNSHNRNLSKALNMHQQTIHIGHIEFSGINAKEERYLRKRLFPDGQSDRQMHIVELEDIIATMMGTKAFEKVTYVILGSDEPYTLLFNCYRAPVNQLGASVRFDAADFASLLFHTGINAHQLTGSRIDFTARLGLNSVITASHTLRTGRGIDFGTELSFQAARNGAFRIPPYDFRIDFNHGRADMFLSLSPWRMMNLQLGIRGDYFYRTSMLTDYTMTGYNLDQMNKSNIFVGPFAQLRSDSFDDPYFPTLGVQFKAGYNWFLEGILYDTEPVHSLQIGYRSAHSAGRFTFIPFLDARHVSAMIMPYINMLSISDANRILDQQITFAGISTPVSVMRTLGSIGLNLRCRLAKRHFITATAQALHQSQEIRDFVDKDLSQTNIGFALEYAYNSIVGPIRGNVHWSDINHSVGFYLGIGLDF